MVGDLCLDSGGGIKSGVPVHGTGPCDDCSVGRRRQEEIRLELSVNSVTSSVGVGLSPPPPDVRSVTDVGMQEKRSRKKRKVRAVVMMVVGAADAGWGRVGEGQLEPSHPPACKCPPVFDSFGG